MNVLIIGAGSVGIGLGASLLSQNINVSFYATHKTANQMKSHGIKRIGLFENYSFDYDEFDVYDNYSQIPDKSVDFILICTKTTVNREISEELFKNKRILNRNFKILICQNGFGNDKFYLEYFKKKSENKGDYMITPCHHLFHKRCLEHWLNVKNQCPYCRQQIPPIEEF